MSVATEKLQSHWKQIGPLLTIRNEREYDRAANLLNELLDEIGTDQRHPLYGLLDALGTLVHAYEEEQHDMPEQGGAAVLRFLMEEHGLNQSDLPELGSQGVVSELLSGKRSLNVRQIRALAKRFGVSPGVFL